MINMLVSRELMVYAENSDIGKSTLYGLLDLCDGKVFINQKPTPYFKSLCTRRGLKIIDERETHEDS